MRVRGGVAALLGLAPVRARVVREGMERALVVLVAAPPCALGFSVPVVAVGGLPGTAL